MRLVATQIKALTVTFALVFSAVGLAGIGPVSAEGGLDTSSHPWEVECAGEIRAGWPSSGPPIHFDVAAPDEVSGGEEFTIEIAPRAIEFPNSNPAPPPINEVAVEGLLDVSLMFDVPVNASIESVGLVPESGQGFAGDPTVHVDDAYAPARVVIGVPEVPVVSDSAETTTFDMPTVVITARATGPSGSVVVVRPSGIAEFADAGFRFDVQSASSPTSGSQRCWSSAPHSPEYQWWSTPPGPSLTQVDIVSGPASVATSTTLEPSPTIVDGGQAVIFTARVDATEGVIELREGELVLGSNAVDSSGFALFRKYLHVPGERSFEAVFIGSERYESSRSDPAIVIVNESSTFADVPSGHDFFAEIAWMAEQGISEGYNDASYRPGAPLTRQAMSAFLYRVTGSPDGQDPNCEEPPFLDVPLDHPFCGEIAWMAEQGISEGYEDGTYQPNAALTRQAMSAFLFRATSLNFSHF